MQLVKPRALRPGDCIGIVSTSSPVSAAGLDRLTAYLDGRGYSVRVADGVLDRSGYLAGSAERRAAGMLSRFGDPEVCLVIGAPADWVHEDAPDASTDELVLRCVQGRFPVITGVEFGHQQSKIMFPIGCRVEFGLRGQTRVLRYLEDLVTLDR
jgi:muramoyltetrapeptide carboxypeptidase LdcA involved in peptidoglycan recycling